MKDSFWSIKHFELTDVCSETSGCDFAHLLCTVQFEKKVVVLLASYLCVDVCFPL